MNFEEAHVRQVLHGICCRDNVRCLLHEFGIDRQAMLVFRCILIIFRLRSMQCVPLSLANSLNSFAVLLPGVLESF